MSCTEEYTPEKTESSTLKKVPNIQIDDNAAVTEALDASLKANGFTYLNPEDVIFEDGSNLIRLFTEYLGGLYREGKYDEANTIIDNTITAIVPTDLERSKKSTAGQLKLGRLSLIEALVNARKPSAKETESAALPAAQNIQTVDNVVVKRQNTLRKLLAYVSRHVASFRDTLYGMMPRNKKGKTNDIAK